MRLRTSVRCFSKLLGKIGMYRNKSYSRGIDIERLSYHSLIIVVLTVNGHPFSVIVQGFDSEGFEHTLGESEGRIVVVKSLKERCGDIENAGITVGILSVEVTVYDESEIVYMSLFIKRIGYCPIAHTPISVIVAPYLSLRTVEKH